MSRPDTLRETVPKLRHIVARFAPYLKREWRPILGAFAALFLSVGFRLLEPWPLKFILDRVIAPTATPNGLFAQLSTADVLLVVTLGLVGVVSLRALMEFLSTISFALAGQRVLTRVRADTYAHLHKLPLSYHTSSQSGDLTVRLVSDIGMLKDVAVSALLPLLANVFVLLGMLGVMLWLNPQLALLALAVLPVFWLFSQRQSSKIREVSRAQRKREGALAATVAESLTAIKAVQALGLETHFSKLFGRANDKSLRDGVKAKRLTAGLERTTDILIAVATALVLYFGARVVLSGTMTAGDLVVFVTYLKNAFKPVRDFAKYTARLAKASASGERIIAILDREATIADAPHARPAPAYRGLVQFDDVSFGYDPDHLVLEGFSLTVQPGEHIALVGESGAGKSTLASLLPRLYEPTSGRITVDGTDIRDVTLASLRAQISLVLQEALIFGTTVRDNIAYGAAEVTQDDIVEAARLAGAHDFIERLPAGYDTVLGERGATLSGGQRQRLAIARAALRRSPLLVLDEPTVGLDEENEKKVLAALARLAEGRTTLVITHDLAFASRADRIVFLERGRVTELGTHQALMAQAGRYAALFRSQQAGREPLRQNGSVYAYA